MQLLFLGTGAGMPSKQRNTSAIALKLLEERGAVWLFDCGEATQHQILRTTIKPRKIEKVFITHLHGDHIFGLPGLLGSRSFQGGDEPLDVYGPEGIHEFVETMLRISRTHLSYPIRFHEQMEGVIFEDGEMLVETALLDHVIPSYGFRITQKPLPPKLQIDKATALGVPKGPLLARLKNGEDVVLEDGTTVKSEEVTEPGSRGFIVSILGDTRFCQAAADLSRDADVMVHEATFDAETKKLAGEYGHSTILEAAETARLASAKLLVANHISARFLPEDEKRLLQQVRGVHPDIAIAHDFSEFAWNQHTKKMRKI
ncbi:ribonuclease Z [Planomicrobium sp. CPCC 101110]|uniref:ribonuclease Z n=1 Tax=Planomicrobium sp. CPCC 101110 TaxID=2599619 RepID=UPI0011B852A2|nr:ribonuclease Z [Planomicrobium sp. CPCC 101110]TWT26098.1 ribonuclease Z [Planomicrobium sp. CPCC 101110]